MLTNLSFVFFSLHKLHETEWNITVVENVAIFGFFFLLIEKMSKNLYTYRVLCGRCGRSMNKNE